jgi:single-strand DNA-binding protein
MEMKIEAKGTVVRDPELRRTPKGKLVAEVTIAADEVMLDGVKLDAGEHKWQTGVFWGADATEVVEKAKQGAKVLLSGERKVREYQKDGETRTNAEIHRGTLEVLAPPREKGKPIELKGVVINSPELMQTKSGKFFTRVTVEPTVLRVDGQERDPKTNGPETAVFWDKDATEYARTVKKGMEVAIAGQLTSREYTDRAGEAKTASEIQKASLGVLDRSKDGNGARSTRKQGQELEQGR